MRVALLTLAGVAVIVSSLGAQAPQFKWAESTAQGRFTLKEVSRAHSGIYGSVGYEATAAELPPDKTYTIWTRRVSGPPLQMGSTLPKRESGDIGKILLIAERMSRGEVFDVGLISDDRSVRLFAKVIPFPLEAADGGCRIWLELGDDRGRQFSLFGEGFRPVEELKITTVTASGKAPLESRASSSSSGTFTAPLRYEGGNGEATVRASAASCAPEIKHAYGSVTPVLWTETAAVEPLPDVSLEFDQREWRVGHEQRAVLNGRIVEWVLPGETVETWTELVTVQTMLRVPAVGALPEFSARRLHDATREAVRKMCRNVRWNVVQQTDTEVAYEWQSDRCADGKPQAELAQFFDTRFNVIRVAYAARASQIPPDVREAWLKRFAAAKVKAPTPAAGK